MIRRRRGFFVEMDKEIFEGYGCIGFSTTNVSLFVFRRTGYLHNFILNELLFGDLELVHDDEFIV